MLSEDLEHVPLSAGFRRCEALVSLPLTSFHVHMPGQLFVFVMAAKASVSLPPLTKRAAYSPQQPVHSLHTNVLTAVCYSPCLKAWNAWMISWGVVDMSSRSRENMVYGRIFNHLKCHDMSNLSSKSFF